MKRDDYYNRPKEDSYKIFFWAIIGMALIIIAMVIFSCSKITCPTYHDVGINKTHISKKL
jgi:hypothetical protein